MTKATHRAAGCWPPLRPGPRRRFSHPTNITVDGTILSIVAGDFNSANDGIADFAVSYQTGALTASVVLFLGRRDGHFEGQYLPQIAPTAYDVVQAAADVNLDGKLDIVMGQGVALGNGDGTFQSLIPFTFAPSPSVRPAGIGMPFLPFTAGSFLQVVDFNNDGIPDICIGSSSPAGMAVRLGHGDGTFSLGIPTPPPFPFQNPFDPDELAVFTLGDFDGDGFVDIAYEAAQGGVVILYGNGDGTFTRLGGAQGSGAYPGALIAGDLRSDGVVDLVDRSDQGVGVMLRDSDDVFPVNPPYLVVYPGPTPIAMGYNGPLAMADFDGDKKQDIASYFAIYAGNGDGSLRAPVLFGQEPGLTSSYVDTGELSPFTGTPDALPYNPPPMVVADVNGDGKPDLIGVGPTLDTITVLINSSGTPVASAPAYQAASGLRLLSPGSIAHPLRDGPFHNDRDGRRHPTDDPRKHIGRDLRLRGGGLFWQPLLYVSPTQINFLVPGSTTVNGPAMINVVGNGLPKGAHSTLVVPVSPGIFTLDGSGSEAGRR